MGSRAAAWVCAWAALAVVSCGKSEGGTEPIPRADLPSRVASLLCESMASCCQGSGFPLSTPACKAARTAELQAEFNDHQQHMRYDAQAAGDCLAAAASTIVCGQFGEDSPACERVFVADVALGQPCSSSRECASVAGQSVFCASDDEVSPAVCMGGASVNTAAPHGKVGEACFGTCFEGDSCDIQTAIAPAPVPGGPLPQPAVVACYRVDGLYCDIGHCAPLLTLGEVCAASDACRDGIFCNFDTHLCTAPQPDGSPCDSDAGCQSQRCDLVAGDQATETTEFCVAATHVTAAQCERAAATGAPPDATTPGGGTTEPGPAPEAPGAGAGTP